MAELFAGNPKLRPIFPASHGCPARPTFHALTHIVHSLRTPEEMEPYLSQLGLDHRKYGVLPEHYPETGPGPPGHTVPDLRGRVERGAEAAWAGASNGRQR